MLKKILPHVSIVFGNMYIVLFLIDRYNRAMTFIDNDITKWLLLVFVFVSAANSVFLIRQERRRITIEEKKRLSRAREQAKANSGYSSGRSSYRR